MGRSHNTIGYYDAYAGDFEKIPFGDKLVDLFSSYVSEKTSLDILDVGSGPGSLAKRVSDEGHRVICLDPSKAMIDRCKKKGLSAYQGTLDDFETKQKFSVVLAISSLIHLPKEDLPHAISVIAHLLDPSGLFFISMLLGEGEKVEDPRGKGIGRHFSYFQKEELESIFDRAKFSIVESQEIESTKVGKTFAVYVLKKLE